MNLFFSFSDTFNRRTKRSTHIICDDERGAKIHDKDNLSECKKYARTHGIDPLGLNLMDISCKFKDHSCVYFVNCDWELKKGTIVCKEQHQTSGYWVCCKYRCKICPGRKYCSGS